ncbi:hypothetical protein B1H18_01650 [Streptomyces tsukubensis]|uniref:Glycoside hydrolase family 3 C-terminal domain-containing protein n=1 Tax=Streptomyces tsukubensis TaxID=83656 RepID=A0A1V4AGF8_9ACTN|nr:hypothetical protein B1H18_01650 [Streptomyces tsukubensis]
MALNTGGVVDTSFFEQINSEVGNVKGGRALDALVLMGQAGQESGSALVEVLNGTVTPSGRLTDTWASAYAHYPASSTFAKNDGDSRRERYTEGVYVGYRYFDSLYRKIAPRHPADVVTYPFGYDKSYTSFRIEPRKVTADAHSVKVTAKVTNTGRVHSGREVVQVCVSALPAASADGSNTRGSPLATSRPPPWPGQIPPSGVSRCGHRRGVPAGPVYGGPLTTR